MNEKCTFEDNEPKVNGYNCVKEGETDNSKGNDKDNLENVCRNKSKYKREG